MLDLDLNTFTTLILYMLKPDVEFGAAIFLNAGPNVFEDVRDVRFTFGPASNASAIHEKERAYSVCLRM